MSDVGVPKILFPPRDPCLDRAKILHFCRVFRRHHVQNDPVNFVDPSGLKAPNQAMTPFDVGGVHTRPQICENYGACQNFMENMDGPASYLSTQFGPIMGILTNTFMYGFERATMLTEDERYACKP